jgi:hypothetical protein
VLEKVEVDIQGPFFIANIDGTRYNIKCVDTSSGYVKTELLQNKSSTSTADFIKRLDKFSISNVSYYLFA